MNSYKINIFIYCINLKRENKRKEVMIEQFHKNNLKYKICNAIDSSEIKWIKLQQTSFYDFDHEERRGIYNTDSINLKFYIKSNKYYQIVKTNGHVGCTLSHLYYIHQAYLDNIKYLLIIEDDISLNYIDKWAKSIENIINEAPNDWKIIKLHCSNSNILNKYIKKEQFINISDNNESRLFWSTGFYIINKNGMEDIIKRYYNEISKTYTIFEKYPVADYILHIIKGVYYYSIPLVKNNNVDHSFKSSVSNSKTLVMEEKKGIEFVENYYENL